LTCRAPRAKQEAVERKARRLFLEEERAKESERRVEGEARWHAQMVTKTKRLRELRLASLNGRKNAQAP